MVNIKDLRKRYGNRVLFENVTLTLSSGKRYGLIGANGAGKTTFLKILAGAEEATDGEIFISGDLRVGVLEQNQFAYETYTLFDTVLMGNKRLYDAIKEKEKLYASGEFTDEVTDRLSRLEIITAEEDPNYECDVKIEKILEQLGFDKARQQEKMSVLTGGDKFKVLLAQVLFPKPDILFLDEPTNNLDMKTISWLEEQLQRHKGTMVVISHDRHFLNAVCTNMLDVDYGTVKEFAGNYDDWYIAANLLVKQRELELQKNLAQKADLERFIARFSANASKAKQATSRQKQLEKLDTEELKPSSRREPSIVFKPKRQIGNECLSVENLSRSYGSLQVLKDLSLRLDPNEKVALIGANGVGKTTFCKILSGELEPDAGTVKWGATISTSYFPQDVTDRIKTQESLYDWLRSFDKRADLATIRNNLGRMLFSKDEQEKSACSVSGGEKHRVWLSKMMLEGGNFLILDEPSNHLDLESIIALGEALYNFSGGCICVAHDRELIDAFANRIIEFKAGGEVVDFKGSYEEYLLR
ncbi:MAG: ABC-F family ATP-binding cassette domain-containing protein [Helicobacteraceae bacterium]